MINKKMSLPETNSRSESEKKLKNIEKKKTVRIKKQVKRDYLCVITLIYYIISKNIYLKLIFLITYIKIEFFMNAKGKIY
jgi:hypothetical protein